ncbi:hypothetical protein Tco_0177750, partial [Tanacetum coccineum]
KGWSEACQVLAPLSIDIMGDERGKGTTEGAGETGSEPDDHSGDGDVCPIPKS